jgi:hypothetical protein
MIEKILENQRGDYSFRNVYFAGIEKPVKRMIFTGRIKIKFVFKNHLIVNRCLISWNIDMLERE